MGKHRFTLNLFDDRPEEADLIAFLRRRSGFRADINLLRTVVMLGYRQIHGKTEVAAPHNQSYDNEKQQTGAEPLNDSVALAGSQDRNSGSAPRVGSGFVESPSIRSAGAVFGFGKEAS